MFKNKRKYEAPSDETPFFSELNSLGVRWSAECNKFGYKYIFFDVTMVEDNCFALYSRLGKKVLFVTLHYDKKENPVFLHPDTGKRVDFDDIFKTITERFPDIDALIVSSCYPVQARRRIDNRLFKDVIFLGDSDKEYSVMFYPKQCIAEIIPSKHG